MSKLNWEKLIVALDLEDKNKIKKIISSLYPKVRKFKIGLVPFSKFGPDIISLVNKIGAEVFLDLKLYDIPNTMKKAARIGAKLKVWAFTVHIKAGQESLEELKADLASFCKKEKIPRPLIFGVSELTSKACSKDKVLRLVGLASKSGLDGVVCSAREAALIKKRYKNLKVITPGIRSKKTALGDQKRIATAIDAFKNGADYIVVGRPIIEEKDYLKAAQEILAS